jgi:hypothetical protein
MAAYPKTYTLPARELEVLRALGMSYAEARSGHDGYLSSWVERRRFERDGKQWVTLQERGQGWAVELAVEAGDVVDVRPLTADEARALERA